MYKSRLQEECQKRRWPMPKYDTEKIGLDHNPRFRASVSFNGLSFAGLTECSSAKEAQNEAARIALLNCTTADRFAAASAAANTSPSSVSTANASSSLSVVPGPGSLHALQCKAKVTLHGQATESSQSVNSLEEAGKLAERICSISLTEDVDHEDLISTYKSLLLELAQKEGFSAPVYETSSDGPSHIPAFSSTVKVEGEKFNGTPAKTKKQAEQNAAKVAWCAMKKQNRHGDQLPRIEGSQNAEIVSSGANSAANDVFLLPESSLLETSSKSASCIQLEGMGSSSSCKNQLQIYAQKKNLNLPSYECVREGSLNAVRYKAKVTVGGQTFESPRNFSLLKEAENAAARTALMSLSVDGGHEDTVCLYKNLLLELAQKEGHATPVFETSINGPPHFCVFLSTVRIEGETFNGIAAKTKKQAEQNAAKIAWCRLNERKSSRRANMPPNFEICENLKDTSGEKSATNFLQQPELSPAKTSSGSTSCIQPEADCRDGSSKDCQGLRANINDSSMVPHYGHKEAAKSSVGDSGSQSKNGSAAEMKESLGDELSMAPEKHESCVDKNEKNRGLLPLCRVQVYPQSTDFVLPAGSTSLPFSDDNWMAVSFDSVKN